eukprot:770713-Alexandrium_andersonii.AAC.1
MAHPTSWFGDGGRSSALSVGQPPQHLGAPRPFLPPRPSARNGAPHRAAAHPSRCGFTARCTARGQVSRRGTLGCLSGVSVPMHRYAHRALLRPCRWGGGRYG